MSEILEASPASDWRRPDPENTLYMEIPGGRVVMELAPAFAPLHFDNIRKLVREHYFDGLAIIRSQDNWVVQWGDPEEDESKAKPLGTRRRSSPPSTPRRSPPTSTSPALPDPDGYAPEVGFSDGFPVGHDPKTGEAWLTHCYGAIGVARGTEEGTGNGSSLYVIIGQAPRQLDRNIAVVGRVLQGMEMLSAIPRGPAPMGFYDEARAAHPDHLDPGGRGRAGGGAHAAGGPAHRLGDLQGRDRGPAQPPRRFLRASGRPYRAVQRAACRCVPVKP
jgi:peptidylprolyl isomerase